LSINKDVELEFCESCTLEKQHWEPFPKEGGLRVAKLLGLVHCDIQGLVKTSSFRGCVVFLDFHPRLFEENILVFSTPKRRMLLQVQGVQGVH
jgi:hypothetical protein